MKTLKLISGGLLLLAFAKLPIVYYTFLHLLIFLSAILIIFKEDAKNLKQSGEKLSFWIIVFGLVGILYNPIIPAQIDDKITWLVIYSITATVFAVSAFYKKKVLPIDNLEKHETRIDLMEEALTSAEIESLTEMKKERINLGMHEDNFEVIARMIGNYYMELLLYMNRFPNEKMFFLLIGILDAKVYIFQEHSIEIDDVGEVVDKALKHENFLLEFTIGIGVLIGKAEEPNFYEEDIRDTWNSQRERLGRILASVKEQYPNEDKYLKTVKEDVQWFFNHPQSQPIREKLGVN